MEACDARPESAGHASRCSRSTRARRALILTPRGRTTEGEMTQARGGGPALPLYWSGPARAGAGWGLFLAALPLSGTLPQGEGQPVLVLPGLLAGDASTTALRCVLRGLG